jgi:hypothetical protein
MLPIGAKNKSGIICIMREISEFGFGKKAVTADDYINAQAIPAPFGDDSFSAAGEKRALTPEECKKFIATFADRRRRSQASDT